MVLSLILQTALPKYLGHQVQTHQLYRSKKYTLNTIQVCSLTKRLKRQEHNSFVSQNTIFSPSQNVMQITLCKVADIAKLLQLALAMYNFALIVL